MTFRKTPIALAAVALFGATQLGAQSGGTPYSGSPIALPKTFPAADFDKGGQGVAYRDLSAGNSGGQYRTGEDVDIIASENEAGPYAINYFQTGEWVSYTVSVPTSGTYDIAIQASQNYSRPTAFHIEVDGKDVTGQLTVPKTGSWAEFQWVGKEKVQLSAGTHVIKVVADNEYFNFGAVRVLANGASAPGGGGYTGTPYSGTPVAAPKEFAAADFDKGGQGVAYHDLSAGNSGGQYRTSEDVDIIASSDPIGPYAVNYFQSGEWLAYTVKVPAKGKYKLGIKAASNYTSPAGFHIEVDGKDATGNVRVPNTGGWSAFQWIDSSAVDLDAGTHVVKVVADAEYFNLAAVRVVADGATSPDEPPADSYAGTPYNGSPIAAPKEFAAADFDKGGQGIAYHDLSAGNAGGQYRTSEDVDIIASTDPLSPYAINGFQTGEWVAYTIDVPAAGTYDLGIKAASNYTSPGGFHIEIDGKDVTGKVAVPNTGGWSTFEWVDKQGVSLAAGKHVLKVVADAEYFNFGGVRVVSSGDAPGDTYAGTPFNGAPIKLPKAFPAADFDKGGQGVAYRDETAGNAGGQYRAEEDVDIINGGDDPVSPYSINYFQTGEWLAYTVEVPKKAKYDISVRAANNYDAATAFRIEVDGKDVTGKINVPNTGGWSTYQWVGKQGVELEAGKRVVKLVSDAEYFNVAGLSILESGTGGTPGTAPTVTFTAPQQGATVSGSVTGGACEVGVSGSTIKQVQFFLDGSPLNTELEAPYNCIFDTTRFSNGTHVLKAVATATDGVTGSTQVSVNVQNSTGGGDTGDGGGGTPGEVPSGMLFWSGFDGSISPGTPNSCYSRGCWQEIDGTDSVTGFSFPPKVGGSSGKFQLLVDGNSAPTPSTVSNYMYNEIQTVTGRNGKSTRALYSHIKQSGCCGTNPQGSHATQNPYLLFPSTEVPQLYVSYWIKFQPDLREKMHSGDPWRPILEFKTPDDDYRFTVGVLAFGGAEPYWEVQTNTYVPSYKQYWKITTNGQMAVPGGKWMKLEVFWRRSTGSDGRMWVAVDGKVIADRSGPNMGPNRSRINRIMLTQLYSGSPYPIYQWVDDVQIWSTFPTARSGDAWYNPPYATH